MPTPIAKKPPLQTPPQSSGGKKSGNKTPRKKTANPKNPAIEQPLSYGCSVSRQSLISTPITPEGNGTSGACTLGRAYGDSFFQLLIGLDSITIKGKLLPAGTKNLPGTSADGSSLIVRAGLQNQKYKAITSWSHLVTTAATHFGIGNYVTGGTSWNLASIQKEQGIGIGLLSGKLLIQPYISFVLESLMALDKPGKEATGRDIGKRMALNLGFEVASRDVSTQDAKNPPTHLQWIHYVYSDFMAGLATLFDYESFGRDSVISKTAVGKMIGTQNVSSSPSASSDIPTLLLATHVSGGLSDAKARLQIKKMKGEWQDNISLYHLVSTGALGLYTAYLSTQPDERAEALAPAVLSAIRKSVDLWALRHSKSPREAMLYHLAIGGGMMALGALTHGSAFSKAFSLAGQEGISATALSPDAFDSKKWIHKTRYEYQPLSSYSRSGGVGHIDDKSRPSVRIQTTFFDSPFYIAATASTPMGDIRSIGGRTSSFISSSEGTVKYANTDIDIPSAMASTLGLQASSASKGSRVSVHGNIGAGTQMELNNNGIEAGLMGEIGVGIDFHPYDSWSLGVSARCSATKFIDGHATDCSVGLGLSFSEQKK